MTAFEIVRVAHIAAGAAALSTFWLPMVAKKGGALHRRVGWAYVVSTAAIAATALVVCAGRLMDGEPKNDAPAIFLAYVALFAGAAASYGVRVLRTKKRTSAHRGAWDLALPSALVACGVALATFGALRHSPLYVAFAALGLVVGVMQLRFWLRPPATKREWWLEHMSGMGISSIATLTAFFVVNAQRIGLGSASLVVWFAPGIVGGVALGLWQRYYRARLRAA